MRTTGGTGTDTRSAEQIVAALRAEIDALAQVTAAPGSVDGLKELITQLCPASSQLRGITSRALGELHELSTGLLSLPVGEGGGGQTMVSTSCWLRHTAQLSAGRAGSLVRTASALRELPVIADAVVDGVIPTEHAGVLARLVGKLETPNLVESQEQMIEVATMADPDALGHYVRHLIATYCEPDLEAQERKAEARRHLQLTNNHDGSWNGRFSVPDAAMETIKTVLEPLARPAGLSDSRSAGQRRADALVDVFAMAARHGDLPEAGGQRPCVSYVVPAEWAMGTPPPPFRPNPGAGSGSTAGSTATSGSTTTAGSAAMSGSTAPSSTATSDSAPTPGSAPTSGATVGADPDLVDSAAWPADRWCASGAWTGPVTRATLATIGCDAQVEVLRITRDGRVLSLTALGEAITKAQRKAVWARDRHCVVRGCTRPPAMCDVHHVRARADGGATSVENLVLLCRRHHTAWHRGAIGLAELWAPWLDEAPVRARAGPG